MKKKVAKRQIERIRKVARKWITPLGLRWWNKITWRYHDGDDGMWETGNQTVIVMRTTARWEYLWATVDCNLTAISEMTDDDLEQGVLHELAHILLAEIRANRGQKHFERTCTRLAQIFTWIREAT